jgi:PAS domain S-box-containing protein
MSDYNILYVDDEQASLNLVKSLFRGKFNFITTNSGQRGLEILKTQSVQLIIADQSMPEMTGIEFLKKVKEFWPDIKCILIAAHQDNKVIEEAVNEVGIYWYINKPFDSFKLEHIIKKAFETYHAEKEKIATNKKLQLLLETAMDAIIIIDDQHIIRILNPAATDLFEYKIEELVGKNMNILLPDNIHDHGKLINSFARYSSHSKIMQTGKTLYGKTKSGKLVPIETTLSKMKINGKLFFNAFIRDITQKIERERILYESEKKFKGVFESMVDVFFRRDLDGKAVMLSPSVFNVLGYTVDEVINNNTLKFYVDPHYPEFVMNKLLKDRVNQTFEAEIIKKDGSIAVITSNAKLYYDDAGNPKGIESVFRDITEKKIAERKIAESRKKLKELTQELTIAEEKMRKQMAIDLHDDVGQLLSSSRMQLAAIDFDSDPVLIEIKIKSISQTLLQATQAIRNVIFNLSPPQLNEIGLYAAIDDWMKEEIDNKYKIQTKLLGDKMIYAIDDNTRFLLFRSVRELLINIIKHARAKLIQVSLKTNHKSLIIVVKDNGIGFDYYSEKFRKSNKSYGLFSIEERFDTLGGSMTIVSKLNFGSEIKLTIPLG